MRKITFLILALSFIALSCNKSDDNTPPSNNDLIKKIKITTENDKDLPEYTFFYDTTIDFQYNKENNPSSILSSIRYRDVWNFNETGEFSNKIIQIQERKDFVYDKESHLLLEEKITSERGTRIKTFQYDNFQRIKSIKEEDKESIFTYHNGDGKLINIQIRYTTAENQHLNSIRYFHFDANQNLKTLVYENSNQERDTFYFTYTNTKSLYENNAINFTLTDGLDGDILAGTNGRVIKNRYPDFMSNLEYSYKGNFLLDNIKIEATPNANFFMTNTEENSSNSYTRVLNGEVFTFFSTF